MGGDEDSVERELAAAAKARGLEVDDDDDDSEAETEILSVVEHTKLADTDPSNKRARKFFFTFLREVLNSIRSWESAAQLLEKPASGSKPGGKGGKGLPTTLSFNTNSEGMSCVLSSCGKSHKNKHGKPSNLKLFEKNKIIKSAVVCTKCLSTGHKQRECRSTLTCGTCGSATHHSLVCRNNSKGDKVDNTKPKQQQKPKDGNTSAFKTETEEDGAGAGEVSGGATVEELPEKTSHCLNVFSLTDMEA